MDFSKMNGYEFEQYITSLVNYLGFTAQQTSLSGDGGVDILAYYDKPFLKGLYLIQCKNWANPVGQPQVRDLYGVVMSQRANKGILVTTSSFTDQAIEFAEGLNIELIDGKMLSEIADSFESETDFATLPISTPYYEDNSFDNDRFSYLKKRKEKNRDYNSYEEYLAFLLSYVQPQSFFLLNQGLDKEIIAICDDMLSRFCKNYIRDATKRSEHIFIKAYLYFVTGQVASCIECLNEIGLFDFNLRADSYTPCRTETNTSGQDAVLIDNSRYGKIYFYDDCCRREVMITNLLILAHSIEDHDLNDFERFIIKGLSSHAFRDFPYFSDKVLIYLANYTMEAINQNKYQGSDDNRRDYKWYPYFFTLKKEKEYSIENTCYMKRAVGVKESLVGNWDNLSQIIRDINHIARVLGFTQNYSDKVNPTEERRPQFYAVVSTDYDIIIEEIGTEKAKFIKYLREYGFSYKTIKDIIDNLPATITAASKEDAERFFTAIKDAGAKCSIKEIHNRGIG